jgi:hypothetical protein
MGSPDSPTAIGISLDTALSRTENGAMGADRKAVARLLAARQPIQGDDARAALQWDRNRWWAAVAGCELFVLTGKGWTLTQEGRLAVAVLGPED